MESHHRVSGTSHPNFTHLFLLLDSLYVTQGSSTCRQFALFMHIQDGWFKVQYVKAYVSPTIFMTWQVYAHLTLKAVFNEKNKSHPQSRNPTI